MVEFHNTRMGQKFYEGTLPRIATSLEILAISSQEIAISSQEIAASMKCILDMIYLHKNGNEDEGGDDQDEKGT